MANTTKLSYYWCIVPMCENTSIKTPEKTFIQVPRNEKRRKLWLNLVRRDPKEFSKTSCVFVCEDHFDLETDMETYMRWKMIGGLKLMKPDAVPHKFACQKKRKLTCSQNIPRKSVEKRGKLQEVEEAMFAASTSKLSNVDTLTEKVSEPEEHLSNVYQAELKKIDIGITVKPHYQSKQTQTIREVAYKSCSPFTCASTSIGTSPFVMQKLAKPKDFKKQIVFSSSDNSESITSSSASSFSKTNLQGAS